MYRIAIPKPVLDSLVVLEPSKTIRAVILNGVIVAALLYSYQFLLPKEYFWYLYIPFIFVMAGRLGVFLQVVHEGSHHLISHSSKINRWIATLCAFSLGVNYEGYARGHMKHHANTATENDPPSDAEKRRVTDFRNPKLYLFFLKDLFGITALSIFFNYGENEKESNQRKGELKARLLQLKTLGLMASVQLVILGALFHFKIENYLLLWIVPAISPHMFLMRIRGIAEHGLAKQLQVPVHDFHEGNYYTRSFLTPTHPYRFAPLTWLEKILIGSLNVHYHHEHHLYPEVPFYHLPKVHRQVALTVAKSNPDTYATGYFSAAMKNLFEAKAVSMVPAQG